MKKLKELLPGIIMLIIIILGVIGIMNLIWTGLSKIGSGLFNLINTISTLDTVLVIALISGAITILGLVVNSIISIALKASEHRNKAKTELRVKMEKPYSQFIGFIFDTMKSTKANKPINDEEMLNRMMEFSKEVTLFGSNKVVKRWAKYRTSAATLSSIENLSQLESILFAIREDLGMKKRGMKKGDILSMFINDIKTAFRVKSSK